MLKLKINGKFIAKDKLGRKYTYKYFGVDKTIDNCYNIHLFNITTCSHSFVEKEWFNQREIKPI